MILIAAPQKITVESGNPTDSVAVTREALPMPESSLLNGNSVFETGFRIEGLPPSPQNVDLAHSTDDEYRVAPDPEPESDNEKSSDALPLGAWMPESTASDPLPPPRATDIDSSIQSVRTKRQQSAAKSRHVMLVATIGLCSVLIAIGILVVFLRWVAQPKEIAQNKPPVVAKQPVGDPAVGPGADSLMTEGGVVPDAQPLTGDNPNPADSSNSEPNPLDATGNTTNPADNPPSSNPPSSNTPSSNTPGNDAAQSKPTDQTGPTTVGNATETKKPLGGSIAPSLDSVLGSSDPAPGQSTGDVPQELPPGLQGFAKLFNQGFEPAMNDSALTLEKPTELPASEDKQPADQPAAVAIDELVPATVDKLLKTRLSGLLINKRRLSETLTTLSLVSDIPIVPDLDSLLVIGASKDTTVEVRATSPLTMEEVLNATAASAKISLVTWNNRVIYARASDDEIEARVPAVLPIADLVTDDAQRDQLLQGLKEVLPEIAEAIAIAEGGVQLKLSKENRLVGFQLARLLETWRVARGLSNEASSAVVPKNCLLPEWPVAAMQQAAKTPIKQLIPAEPIARTWQRVSADALVACWVDWYGLQMAETNPRTKATVIAAGRPLSDILQHYANKYQIVFAIEDGRSLWVTSPDMHRLQPRLFLLPLSEKSAEEWTAELEPLAPMHPTTGASMLKLIPSPDGQYLFVRCCRPILVEPN